MTAKLFFIILFVINVLGLSNSFPLPDMSPKAEQYYDLIKLLSNDFKISDEQKQVVLETAKEGFYKCGALEKNSKYDGITINSEQYQKCLKYYTSEAKDKLHVLEKATNMEYLKSFEDDLLNPELVIKRSKKNKDSSS